MTAECTNSGTVHPCLQRTPREFTGKERDQETELDYFGARYISGVQGRFSSPDPSNLSVDFHLPQTWNRYSYALNNPLEMVDQNGLWPWPIHNQIISQAFPGMSADQLKTLRDASWNMDYGPGQQDASKSYQHGMSDGLTSQDPSSAEEEGVAFGNALHTITDRTSPAHVENQPWYGTKWWQTQSIIHYQQERNITPGQMQTAVDAARQAFRNTFGNEFDWMLLLMKQGGACVTAHDSASGTTFGGCQ
ncbi:MAG TPA: RHS repeat-associated core domain-containing protein [Bryobacteraceae bacterium]|nr:RHS repeat-associated core domain-containing protein [Bryobacteraceae bacterium]